MSIQQLGNCPKCKKLYLRIRDICDECFQKQEEDYLKAAAYLREYPGSTIQDVSDNTGVSVAQIRYFIQIGRIIAGHFPNLSYPCATCGSPIQTGKVCKNCMDRYKQLSKKEEDRNSENGQPHNDNNSRGYIKYL